MSHEWVLPTIYVDPGWTGSERVLHNAIYDFIVARFPAAAVEYEAIWPVGRPDLVITTQIAPGFRTVAIIEVKRHRANVATVEQLSRYWSYRVGRALQEPGYTEVIGILAAPWLAPDVRLSENLMYLPVVAVDGL